MTKMEHEYVSEWFAGYSGVKVAGLVRVATKKTFGYSLLIP